MMKISINEIFNKYKILINKEISIYGWVKSNRNSKIGISFISINDGSCFKSIQVIANKDLYNYIDILKINTGYSINVIGKVIISKGEKQNIEIKSRIINILGNIYNSKEYPISSKFHSFEFLRKFPHLRPRTNIFSALSRVRNFIFNRINNFMYKNGFKWIPTPIITSIDTEGNSKLFKVSSLNIYGDEKIKYINDFFCKESFLTVSGQLNLEAYACSLSKVYSLGPVFRAENSNTTKHLSEFWMLELEAAFINLDELINLSINIIKNIYNNLIINLHEDIIFLHKKNNINSDKLFNIINSKYEIIEYKEIIKILNKNNFNIKFNENITSKYENFLLNFFKNILIIKNYPKKIKPFYMKLNDDNLTVSSMDILVPGIGELIGGSVREDRLDFILKSVKENNINLNDYNWYIDLRKYGTVPHSGFGLGFERFISFLTGIKNIKDISPFPRNINNLMF
ncbi:asparagine--tRNA ligase [endosymbiont of Sipalinus gigas]|uniref:asparagine--tRNA ligase n=1 Tax=endosymbiont of Sipalinus gigas TaxID=1972134 RepID=UPI00102E7F65|nr:asparagine--tRNA ligase [endosymbiont of Sipalinus gigas]